jgi:hypothetical protein
MDFKRMKNNEWQAHAHQYQVVPMRYRHKVKISCLGHVDNAVGSIRLCHTPTFLLNAAAEIHGHLYRLGSQFEEFSDCGIVQLTRILQALMFYFQQRVYVFMNIHLHLKVAPA